MLAFGKRLYMESEFMENITHFKIQEREEGTEHSSSAETNVYLLSTAY